MSDQLVSELAWRARPGIPRHDYLQAALEALARVFPCDSIGWNSLDATTATVEAFGAPDEVFSEPGQDLLAGVPDHPMVVSYLADASDIAPRRMSDLASRKELRSTAAYDLLLHPLETEFQFTIVTQRSSYDAAGCWTFNRRNRDFTDDDLALAARLQPLLILIERSWGVESRADAPLSSLSHRENQILGLLATGITAGAIGTRLGISRSTVTKHLEHIYRKLGVRDRLTAVQRARAEGADPPAR